MINEVPYIHKECLEILQLFFPKSWSDLCKYLANIASEGNIYIESHLEHMIAEIMYRIWDNQSSQPIMALKCVCKEINFYETTPLDNLEIKK